LSAFDNWRALKAKHHHEELPMKRIVLTALLATVVSASALAADVGVSINIAQPGFYGRIDVGHFPQVQVVYPQPVIIAPSPVAVIQQPIYLRVPPGHAKNWGRYCGGYNACGQRVYFVQEGWYNTVYVSSNHRGSYA
jgi:opacity protein-like surface antigen